jgi:hypothetical protein
VRAKTLSGKQSSVPEGPEGREHVATPHPVISKFQVVVALGPDVYDLHKDQCEEVRELQPEGRQIQYLTPALHLVLKAAMDEGEEKDAELVSA